MLYEMASIIEEIDRAKDDDQIPRKSEPVREPIASRDSPKDIILQDTAQIRNLTIDHRHAVEITRLKAVLPAVKDKMRDNMPSAY